MENKNLEENQEEDVIVEEIQEEQSSFKEKTEEKKLSELDECKNERQEYLDG
jgi:hypothetical protein